MVEEGEDREGSGGPPHSAEAKARGTAAERSEAGHGVRTPGRDGGHQTAPSAPEFMKPRSSSSGSADYPMSAGFNPTLERPVHPARSHRRRIPRPRGVTSWPCSPKPAWCRFQSRAQLKLPSHPRWNYGAPDRRLCACCTACETCYPPRVARRRARQNPAHCNDRCSGWNSPT